MVQLFKERQTCDELLNTREVELEELREQLEARDDAVKYIERMNERNLDEYMRTLQESTMQKEKNETQSSMHIRNLQETIEAQTQELEAFIGHYCAQVSLLGLQIIPHYCAQVSLFSA